MSFGKILIVVGIIFMALGLMLQYRNGFPFLGKLPGDIVINREGTKIFIPITTSIFISIVLSLLIFLINRLRG